MMTKAPCTWPNKCPVRPYLQTRIETAARNLAQLCIQADIDLSYVDADGLTVKVDRAKPKRRKRRAR